MIQTLIGVCDIYFIAKKWHIMMAEIVKCETWESLFALVGNCVFTPICGKICP